MGFYLAICRERLCLAWREGKGKKADITVRVYNGREPTSEYEEWEMPGVLPLDVASAQAEVQTK